MSFAGSDAEEHVARRFPQKTIKRVGNGLRPRSIQRFLSGLRLTFQPGKSKGLDAVYHFSFTGNEEKQATVTIRDGKLAVEDGHIGEPNLRVIADSETWLGFSGEGAQLAVGLAPPKDSHQGFAEAAGGLWQMFSVVMVSITRFACLLDHLLFSAGIDRLCVPVCPQNENALQR